MSDYLIKVAEFMTEKFPETGLSFDQWQKLIVNGPWLITDAVLETYKRRLADEATELNENGGI